MNAPSFFRSPFPRMAVIIGALAAVASIAGCRSPLPQYPELDPQESLRIIADRLSGVRAIQSTATIDFEESSGSSVRLDGALAAQPPELLRIRAWKFDRAVFDATLREGELWLLPTEAASSGDRAEDSGRAAEGVRRAFTLLTGAFYRRAEVDADRTTRRRLVVVGSTDEDTLRCVIDRSTLTPLRFERLGDDPARALSIDLDDYALIDGVQWPARWTISHPRGRVTIQMDDVELNGDIPPAAFTPPRRAVRRD